MPNSFITVTEPLPCHVNDVFLLLYVSLPEDPTGEYVADWIDKNYHLRGAVERGIILSSLDGSKYNFRTQFNISGYVIDGQIDLSTNYLSNGSLYVVVPAWGRVDLMEDIHGNLGSSITGQFSRGDDINGSFTLWLNQRQLMFEYSFDVKFIGKHGTKMTLLTLPQLPSSPSLEITPVAPTDLSFVRHKNEYKLFDKFLEDHLDETTKNIVIASYLPNVGAVAPSSTYTFNVSFLTSMEMEGAIDTVDLNIKGTLYVLIPFWGRVKAASFSGNLKDGINQKVDSLIAKGTFSLKLSGRDLRIHEELDSKLAGYGMDEAKLFTLPCTNTFSTRPVKRQLTRFFPAMP
ncbi:hypothetical protein JB92DRAFT_3142422 [Gautieria morchelliformis]|nr:hypothetical protein JB92DRAFT_3142422 [Gautieria morchelliformis]